MSFGGQRGTGFWGLGFVFFFNVPFSGLAMSRKSGAPAGRGVWVFFLNALFGV